MTSNFRSNMVKFSRIKNYRENLLKLLFTLKYKSNTQTMGFMRDFGLKPDNGIKRLVLVFELLSYVL